VTRIARVEWKNTKWWEWVVSSFIVYTFYKRGPPHTRTHRRLLLTTTKILSTSLLSV
jgi:hypothetical protein